MKGFVTFIRERGVVGFAIGFILGGAVSKMVSSFVDDIINPLVGLIWNSSKGLSGLMVGPVALGNFLSASIDFIILAAVVYYVFKGLGLEKLDAPKS